MRRVGKGQRSRREQKDSASQPANRMEHSSGCEPTGRHLRNAEWPVADYCVNTLPCSHPPPLFPRPQSIRGIGSSKPLPVPSLSPENRAGASGVCGYKSGSCGPVYLLAPTCAYQTATFRSPSDRFPHSLLLCEKEPNPPSASRVWQGEAGPDCAVRCSDASRVSRPARPG